MTDQFQPLTRGGYEYRLLRHPDGSLAVDDDGDFVGIVTLASGRTSLVMWDINGYVWHSEAYRNPHDLIPIQEPST